MSNNTHNTVNGVHGRVNEIYATPQGLGLIEDFAQYDEADGGVKEHTEGWLQKTTDQRVRVVRVRISHSACGWKEAQREEIDDLPAGFAH